MLNALSLGGVQWSNCVRFANGYHYSHCSVVVVDERPEEEREAASQELNTVQRSSFDKSSASLHMFHTPLVLERRRLAAPTLLRLLRHVVPKQALCITTYIEDKGDDKICAPSA